MYKDLDLNKLFDETVEARAYALAKEMLESELKEDHCHLLISLQMGS